MPFFMVAWQQDKETGVFLDYPNVLAFLLNPLFFVLCGLLVLGAWKLMVWMVREIGRVRGGLQS